MNLLKPESLLVFLLAVCQAVFINSDFLKKICFTYNMFYFIWLFITFGTFIPKWFTNETTQAWSWADKHSSIFSLSTAAVLYVRFGAGDMMKTLYHDSLKRFHDTQYVAWYICFLNVHMTVVSHWKDALNETHLLIINKEKTMNRYVRAFDWHYIFIYFF